MQQNFITENIEQVNPHLLALTGHPRTEEILVIQRIRIFIFRIHFFKLVKSIDIGPGPRLGYKIDGIRSPCAQYRLSAVNAQTPINDSKRSPRTVMARAENTHNFFRARDGPGIDNTAGRPRIVAPIDRLICAVRIHRPKPLGIPEIAIHILPAIVEYSSVRHERRMALVQRALSNLMDVGSISIHPKKVAHNVTVTHAILRLTRRRENDAVIRQVQRIKIGHTRRGG